MGFWDRLGNLWRGFWSLWVSDVEKAHPEIAYENAINSAVERYSKLKYTTASIIRLRETTETKLRGLEGKFNEVARQLDAAVATNQDDLAVALIEQKQQLETAVAEGRQELQDAVKSADDAKAALLQVQADVKKLQSEREVMLSKFRSAQARIRIQEQLEGLSVDAEVKALDNVRSHIQTTVAQAKLGQELQDSSLDGRLAKLRAQTGSVLARDELAKLKAARGQPAAASATAANVQRITNLETKSS